MEIRKNWIKHNNYVVNLNDIYSIELNGKSVIFFGNYLKTTINYENEESAKKDYEWLFENL